MKPPQTGPARLYTTKRKDTPYVVIYRDPTKTVKTRTGFRAKRVPKWFAQLGDAETYRDQLNDKLLAEGTAGLNFDAVLRTDALSARRALDAAGHVRVTLLQLANEYNARVRTGGAAAQPIGPQLKAFLDDKEHIEDASDATITNLRNRLNAWIDREAIAFVGDIERQKIDNCRRREGVGAHSRRNDLNAVSSFCTYLFDKGLIALHPTKGLKRPKMPHGRKATFTTDETARVLRAAAGYLGGKWLGTLGTMLFLGPRPSELEETRIYYGRHPVARIEGGKLRGRANRTVVLMPAAVAWLKAAGSPAAVAPINSKARRQICRLAGVTWKADITRHTFISNRVALLKNDGAVAREAGTSEEMIHRHYHQLKMPAEARAWAALRPKKLTPAPAPAKLAA